MERRARSYVSGWTAGLSRRIREPKYPRLRLALAVLGLIFAVFVFYFSLTYTGAPYANNPSMSFWLRSRDAFLGVGLVLGSIAFLLPRDRADLAVRLLMVAQVGFWIWLASFVILVALSGLV